MSERECEVEIKDQSDVLPLDFKKLSLKKAIAAISTIT